MTNNERAHYNAIDRWLERAALALIIVVVALVAVVGYATWQVAK